jgi:hypothetical protein
MKQIMKYALPAVLLVILVVIGTLGAMPASAQSSSGQLNPQTQFPVNTKLQITSVYGLETTPLFAGSNFGNRNNGQNGNHNQSPRYANQQWNLTYLRNIPTANSSITIDAQVTNDTLDGGVLWTVQGGSIAYNGTTLTVSNGKGGIGKLDRILMIGNATDSNGNTLRWTLEGLATLYGGSVIVSLTGTVAQINQNTTSATPTQPNQDLAFSRGVSLTYIATISSS